jgi:hypothetical protein
VSDSVTADLVFPVCALVGGGLLLITVLLYDTLAGGSLMSLLPQASRLQEDAPCGQDADSFS